MAELITGFKYFDSLLFDSTRSESIITILGKPRTGQSYLAINMMLNMAMQGFSVGMISLGIPQSNVINCCVSSLSKVPVRYSDKTNLSYNDAKAVRKAHSKIDDLRIYINDKAYSIESVIGQISEWVSYKNVKHVFISQVHKIWTAPPDEYEVCIRLKQLERELGVTLILVTSQNYSRMGGLLPSQPVLSDIYFDGLDEISDYVIALYRPSMDTDESEMIDMADLIAVKGDVDSELNTKFIYMQEYGLFIDSLK